MGRKYGEASLRAFRDAGKISNMYADGMSQKSLARKYRVGEGIISSILYEAGLKEKQLPKTEYPKLNTQFEDVSEQTANSVSLITSLGYSVKIRNTDIIIGYKNNQLDIIPRDTIFDWLISKGHKLNLSYAHKMLPDNG